MVEIIAYTISFILISTGIIKTAYIYLIETIDPNIDDITAFTHAKLNLGEATSLALSFMLGIEILKIFHIKSYTQLAIVICLLVIKLFISYFLEQEIDKDSNKKYNK